MEHGYAISLLLTRAAGKDSAIRGEIGIDESKSGKGTLSLNGKSLGTVTLKDGTGALNYMQTAELVRALVRKANIIFTSNDGLRMRISDAGAAAVLLKMDDFQKRVNTPSALIRPGSSKAAVLEPQALPKIRHVVPKGENRSIERGSTEYALLTAKLKDSECDTEDSQRSLTIFPLSQDRLLAEITCWLGATISGKLYAIISSDLETVHETLDLSLNSYDAPGILMGRHKDCAGESYSIVEYVFDGKTFVKSKQYGTGLCKGFAGGAWDLSTYVSEVLPTESGKLASVA